MDSVLEFAPVATVPERYRYLAPPSHPLPLASSGWLRPGGKQPGRIKQANESLGNMTGVIPPSSPTCASVCILLESFVCT